MTDRTVPLLLTDYEAANLKALLAAMLAGVCPVESPLRAADTGDWTSVIWQKLPELGCAPLASPDELARRACRDRDRYREALERIAEGESEHEWFFREDLRDVAREALGGGR